MKQIKLSDTHYIVMDETREITKDHWCLVTHSTQPIESVVIDVTPNGDPIESYEYNRIKEYPLSLAKEIAGEVNVEKKVQSLKNNFGYSTDDYYQGAEDGYNQCLEDNKDKKYTEEDMRKAIEMSRETYTIPYSEDQQTSYKYEEHQIIQSIQPPTEWEVEIVQGKLKRK